MAPLWRSNGAPIGNPSYHSSSRCLVDCWLVFFNHDHLQDWLFSSRFCQINSCGLLAALLCIYIPEPSHHGCFYLPIAPHHHGWITPKTFIFSLHKEQSTLWSELAHLSSFCPLFVAWVYKFCQVVTRFQCTYQHHGNPEISSLPFKGMVSTMGYLQDASTTGHSCIGPTIYSSFDSLVSVGW